MLRKIVCVMIRVDDLYAATKYYCDVFGLRERWQDEDWEGSSERAFAVGASAHLCR